MPAVLNARTWGPHSTSGRAYVGRPNANEACVAFREWLVIGDGPIGRALA
jgi:hypothetical protein